MDWKTVAEKIIQDDQNKWDRKIAGKELQVTDRGELLLLDGQGEMPAFLLSETATLQLCQKLEIPAKYYRRLPDEMKAMVANFDLGRLNGHSYLLRGKGSGYARSCQGSTWHTIIPKSPRPRRAC